MKYQIFQDQRLKWLTETILHIRTIKSLAWEKLSYEKLHNARDAELVCNQRGTIMGGFVGAVAHTLPWGTLILMMWYLLATDGSVQAHKIVITQRIIGSLLGAIAQLLVGMHKMVAVPNSFRRIRRYLEQEDRPRDIVREPSENPNAPIIRIRGSFRS